MKEQKEIIAEITKRLSNGLDRWSKNILNSEELKNRLLSLLEMELSFLSFDKESTKLTLRTVILKKINIEYNSSYVLAFPPIEYK
jgi:hypothetical protein